MNEQWKPIPGFELYQISDLGRVYRSGKILKPTITWQGYHRYCLYINGAKYQRTVHQLVLEAFVGPRPAGHVAAHRNGNRGHNQLENLRWATEQENRDDMILHGTTPSGDRNGMRTNPHRRPTGERNGNAKFTEEQVKFVHHLRSCGATLDCIAKEFGVTKQAVSHILKGRNWAALKIEVKP